MEPFKLNLFLSKLQRLPIKKAIELVDQYKQELDKMPFAHANQILDFIDGKTEIVKSWSESGEMVYDIMYLHLLTEEVMRISTSALQELDDFNNLHPTIQIEVIDKIEEQERYCLLKNHGKKLTPLGIQTLVLALSEEHQKEMMLEYKKQILSTNLNLIVSFIANLGNNQEEFLISITDFLRNLEKKQIVDILFGLSSENMNKYLEIQKDKINSLNQRKFIEFLSYLEEDIIIPFSELYKEKFQSIPSEVLMYKLGGSISNPKLMYQIWCSNKEKVMELSDTYFNLVISRLKDEERLSSLEDFKDRYNQMDIQTLLDLFEFDSDEMKVQLLTHYHEKIKTIGGTKIIEYINENITDRRTRNQMFLVYKDSITRLTDEEFIDFIHEFSNKNLGYIYIENEDSEEFKKEMVRFLIDNFKERIQNLKLKNIPKLFKDSESELNFEYLDILEQKIKQLINNRTQLEEFINACWGNDINRKLYQKYEGEFSKLTAVEWYQLRNCIDTKKQEIKEFLLKCEINSLDFIPEKDLTSLRIRSLVVYLKENLMNRIAEKYQSLAQTDKEQLLKRYEELVIKVCESNHNQVILNQSCEELIVLLRVLLSQKIISTENTYYQLFREYYMENIFNKLEMENENNKEKIINSLFYRIIKGKVETMDLLDVTTLKGLIFFNKNRIGKDINNLDIYGSKEIETFVQNLTEEQVINFNQKQFRKVCEKIRNTYEYDNPTKESTRNLAIKIYMSVGYEKALKLLDLDIPFTRYEYIFGGIDIKKIMLDENGCPIIPKKLQDFMFGSSLDCENTNMNRLLTRKIPEFEQKFANIYNSWDMIYEELNGVVTINRILKWFEENRVILNPDEYRLSIVLNEISDDQSIEKARELYRDMRKRKYSTIPKISGSTEKYSYEMLDLDDPLGLIVGYITRCCFLINGMSKSALFHSAQNKDGRIFVVRNQSGELIAQSWVWRNGNLVCFDNVETTGRNDDDELLKAYQSAAEKIILTSAKKENAKEQIKLVTVGSSYSKMTLPEKQVPKNEIQLPRTKNEIYTDAYQQFILFASKEKDLYYGDVTAEYKDEREEVQKYSNIVLLEKNKKTELMKKIRSINYLKNGQVSQIDLDNYCFLMLGEDWYLGITLNEDVDINFLSVDERAKKELIEYSCNLEEILEKQPISVDKKSTKQKVLRLLEEGE